LKKPRLKDRKVLSIGQSRCLALSGFIPQDWGIVRIREVSRNENQVVIEITRLTLKGDNNAPVNQNREGNR